MALRYVNPRAETNGDGLSYETAYNTFAGLTWGAHTYLVYPGTLRETITFGAGSNGAKMLGFDPHDKPVVDCENTRNSGIDLNAKVGCEIARIRVINQNAAPANAGIRVTGSANHVHHNELANCQTGIHVNASSGNKVERNDVDCGNPLTPSIAYGIRVNNVVSENNIVQYNRLFSTAVGMTFLTAVQCYQVGTGNRLQYNVVTCPQGDGPSFRFGTSGCYMVGNVVYGQGTLDGLVVEGSSGNFIWNNTVIHVGDIPTHFGPGLKMGDEFGAGTPSANNDIANNVLVSLGPNNCMNLVTIGAGNTFRGNRLWRPSGGGIINLNTGSGTSLLTFSEWQAAGLSTGDTFSEPMLNSDGRPLLDSTLIGAGVHLGYRTDIEGRQFHNPPTIGAYEPMRERRARS
jgi:parallel beta-helix repeat protein